MRMAQRGIDEGSTDPVAPRVVANLGELERIWQEHHARTAGRLRGPARRRAAGGPAGRGLPLRRAAQPRALRRTRSVGAMLAAWAVRAGKVNDLKKAIDDRKGQPLAELPAAILTAQLALAAGDDPAAIAALKVLAERLKRDTLPHHGRARLPRRAAGPRTAAARGGHGGDRGPRRLRQGVRERLPARAARHDPGAAGRARQLQLGDVAGGRKRLEAYIEAMEKNASRYSGDYSLWSASSTSSGWRPNTPGPGSGPMRWPRWADSPTRPPTPAAIRPSPAPSSG